MTRTPLVLGLAALALLTLLTLSGCPSATAPTGTDAGGGGTDTGGGGLDAPVPLDVGPLADAPAGDAGPSTDTGPGSDAGAVCSGGTECTGFPALERGCTLDAAGADVNCAAELHQVDCCGTMRALGMNHGVVGTAFCPAETACRATYLAAACDPQATMLDTGETTFEMNRIHVRCNIPTGGTVGTCETYLGTPDGVLGSCGP